MVELDSPDGTRPPRGACGYSWEAAASAGGMRAPVPVPPPHRCSRQPRHQRREEEPTRRTPRLRPQDAAQAAMQPPQQRAFAGGTFFGQGSGAQHPAGELPPTLGTARAWTTQLKLRNGRCTRLEELQVRALS